MKKRHDVPLSIDLVLLKAQKEGRTGIVVLFRRQGRPVRFNDRAERVAVTPNGLRAQWRRDAWKRRSTGTWRTPVHVKEPR
jgi:hypothetical protein